MKPWRGMGLRFFNLSFIGIFSGEFARQIAAKFAIHPRLWIINADDGGGGNFFSRNLTLAFGADVRPIPALRHSRLTAFKEVVRRNLRWRTEDIPDDLSLLLTGSEDLGTRAYRNARTGSTEFHRFPQYEKVDNPPVLIKRPPDCHTNPEAVAFARDFVRDLGGDVILTVIPNTHYCQTQAREIAASLGIEFVHPGHLDCSSWDGGVHLDYRGSLRLTADLMDAVEHLCAGFP
jgi:hypothetical protein